MPIRVNLFPNCDTRPHAPARPVRIGLVLTFSADYCRRVLRGAKSFADTRPNWLLVPIEIHTRSIGGLAHFAMDGVIAHVIDAPLAAALEGLGKPVVNVASVLSGLPFPRVGRDDRLIGQLAAQHLLERGLRHFGFIGRAPRHAASDRREAAFRAALERVPGCTLSCYHDRDPWPFAPQAHPGEIKPSFFAWLDALPRPAGVFAVYDPWGFHLSEACRQRGLRVPDDVAMVGVDNDDMLCELARPSLSSIDTRTEEIGFQAAALLDHLLAGGRPPARATLIPPTGVVARQSSDILAIDDPDVAAAVRFIRTRGHLPLRVADVLRAVPVSRRSLERRFRKLLRCGVWQEIRRAHLSLAKHHLAESDLPMPAVAERSGLASGKQLSVVFRQETGVTPTAYRQQVRGRTAMDFGPR